MSDIGSDRSQTPEDQALHGQPTDEQDDLDLGPRDDSYAESAEPDEQTGDPGFEQTTTD
jgi:hypothetical protein